SLDPAYAPRLLQAGRGADAAKNDKAPETSSGRGGSFSARAEIGRQADIHTVRTSASLPRVTGVAGSAARGTRTTRRSMCAASVSTEVSTSWLRAPSEA